MNKVINVGFYNFVTADSIVALLDYKLLAAKKIVKSAREERPRSVMDITKGRKSRTLIVLTGDRYIISATYRQSIARRICLDIEDEDAQGTLSDTQTENT